MEKKKEIKFEQPSEILVFMNRYFLVIIAVIIIGLLGVGYFFLLSPKIDNIKELEKETTDIEERRLLNENLLDKIKELENKYDDIIADRENQLSELMKIIPDDPQVAELFIMTERLAKQRGFELQSINISEGADGEVAASVEEAEAAMDEEGVQMQAHSLKSTVIHISLSYEADPDAETEEGKEAETPYQVFKNYLVDLENNLRLMDIQSVSFGSLDPDAEALTFGFDIITYYK
ncbi:hypothetical protein C0580_01595 [Candidatus Parcubacteria bacterium]|nr:MAG: hypothetical protein C0580_01595 [Candidatus Parcubacteria bacterium]